MCVSLCVIQYLCRWLQYMCATMYTLTLQARVRMFVHVVSLSKAQRCHGNIGQKNKKNTRDLGKERVHSRPLGDSYSLAPFLFHDFPSFHVTHILKSFCVSFFIFSQPPFINISRAFFYLGRNNACTETTCHYDRINLTIVNILVSKGPNNAWKNKGRAFQSKVTEPQGPARDIWVQTPSGVTWCLSMKSSPCQ